MKTQTIPLSTQYQEIICSVFAKREDLLFFDIETTGLSAKNASVYLIGAAGKENGSWVMHQWFAENTAAEEAVLDAFTRYAASFGTLVHFNGTTFDVPFLQSRCKKYGLHSALWNTDQFDIYRQISPWKNLLKLANCKQRTLEEFLGIFRKDPFNGGQLIQLYQAYTESGDERLLKVLLLHNADDIRGMLSILPMLAYPALLEEGGANIQSRRQESRDSAPSGTTDCGTNASAPYDSHSPASSFRTTGRGTDAPAQKPADAPSRPSSARPFAVTDHAVVSGTDYAGNPQKELLIRIKLSHPLPAALSCSKDGCFFSAEREEGMLKIPVFTGELKYFYPDYKNYSYLPEEDNAIHKSVAVYVDKAHRVPATPETCYTRKSGEFLPLPAQAGKGKKKIAKTETPGRKTHDNDTTVPDRKVNDAGMASTDKKGKPDSLDTLFSPLFRRSAKEKECFFLADGSFFQDEYKLGRYVSRILVGILR